MPVPAVQVQCCCRKTNRALITQSVTFQRNVSHQKSTVLSKKKPFPCCLRYNILKYMLVLVHHLSLSTPITTPFLAPLMSLKPEGHEMVTPGTGFQYGNIPQERIRKCASGSTLSWFSISLSIKHLQGRCLVLGRGWCYGPGHILNHRVWILCNGCVLCL